MKSILYDWGGFNVWLFHRINDVHGPLLDAFMRLGTVLGDHALFPVYGALLGVASLAATRKAPAERAMPWLTVMVVFVVAYSLDGLVVAWLKHYFDFPRPPLALSAGSVHIVGAAEFRHSLPSGHASFAMLCAASIWPVLGRSGRATAAFFVLWVCVSRVSVGAHFPADVLAGAASSLAIVLLVRAFSRRLAGVPTP